MKHFFSMFLASTTNPSTTPTAPSNQIIDGITAAKDELAGAIKTVMDSIVIPLLLIAAVVLIVVSFTGFLRRRQEGSPYTTQMITLCVSVAVAILFATWYAWGGILLGV